MTRKRRTSNDHTRSTDVLAALERHKIELDPSVDAWAAQPRETPRNYGMFLMYRDMGRIRTVAQFAGMSPLTYSAVARIARLNLWAQRAGLWDAEQERLSGIRLLDAREDMARRHQKIARTMYDKALERLKTLDPDAISPHALILMIDTAAKIERAALGLETLNKGAVTAQTTVTVAASTTTDESGQPGMRVEIGVQHDKIMKTLDALVERMSPEQLAAGYGELTASAEEALRGIDAALPTPPPS